MKYEAALTRLYRLSGRGIRMGLDRVRAAAARLGDPQQRLVSVQIAGTNGKGTVACLLAHAAKASGVRVGLFTSPHLHRFSERIQIDGKEADAELIASHIERVLDLADRPPSIPLTFFEVSTLAAFGVFKDLSVELAVLEVGLGGRLDATSIASPIASAVVSIGLDHTALLGDSIDSIAREKAAIARPGNPMVTGLLSAEAAKAVEETAGSNGARVLALGRDFAVRNDLRLPWPGKCYRENATVALKLFELLGETDPRCKQEIFLQTAVSAKWPCRFEILSGSRTAILDGAHNLEGAEALAQALTEISIRPAAMLFGACADKPVAAMLRALRPLVGKVVLAPPPVERAFDPSAFAERGDDTAETIEEGLELAMRSTCADETVLVAGSLFAAAEARRLLLGEPSDPAIRM